MAYSMTISADQRDLEVTIRKGIETPTISIVPVGLAQTFYVPCGSTVTTFEITDE